jgi:hypothetical protein
MERKRFTDAPQNHFQEIHLRLKRSFLVRPLVAYGMLNAIVVQQLVDHLTVAVDNAKLVSLGFHQFDKVAVIMDMSGVIDIYKDFHIKCCWLSGSVFLFFLF